ncbi:hypothetical protein AAFF_G00208280 [Aldrovandia affinis]|uniref:Uncharacterized protein n=1 Tax=Aldrovandia affinis TaxID=143900 RepID=A0AAD7RJW1_9TELE|nr:hypothetical protein AAFF_G00208280 [Aldrovandia affinis]
MEVSCNGESRPEADRGLWNSPRIARYSKETQQMLQVMMQESRLTQLQQRVINNSIKKEGALPVIDKDTSLTSSPQPSSQEKAVGLPAKRQKRSAEMCRSGDSYRREVFRPGPTRDLEKEKRRLQGLLAEGREEPKARPPKSTPHEREEPSDRDRFEEVVDEIKDRMDFLEEMSALGRGKLYQNIINAEISQKIRELELIDKIRSANVCIGADGEAGRGTPQKEGTD